MWFGKILQRPRLHPHRSHRSSLPTVRALLRFAVPVLGTGRGIAPELDSQNEGSEACTRENLANHVFPLIDLLVLSVK